jgi:hemerythrin-like metal-binding protein
MQVPKFDASLRTGQPLIDEQHEWLFSLAARVAHMLGTCDQTDAATDSTSPDADSCELGVVDGVTEAVYGLLDYATEHFSDEEGLMRAAGYPLVNYHVSLHEELNRRLAPFVFGQVNGESMTAESVAEFFVCWLTDHIMQHDRAFTTWLEAHPLASETS